MNKEQAQQLIERLADKTLSEGCKVITAKDRRMYTQESQRNKLYPIEEQGRLIPAIGTIISKSNTKIYCKSRDNNSPWSTKEEYIQKILGHPVYIGDVLKKLQQQEEYIVSTGDFETINDIITREDYNVSKVFAKLLHHWARCGIENSLQTILDEAEWEGALSLIKVRNGCYELYRDKTKISEHSTISGANSMADKFPPSLKSPALKLFSYLNVLFPDK